MHVQADYLHQCGAYLWSGSDIAQCEWLYVVPFHELTNPLNQIIYIILSKLIPFPMSSVISNIC